MRVPQCVRIDPRKVLPSRHSIFIRGLPSSIKADEIRDVFAKHCDGKCKIDFFSYSEDKVHLFVAIRFDAQSTAKEMLSKYNGETLCGHVVEISWFKDIRKARKKVIENERKYSNLLASRQYEPRRQLNPCWNVRRGGCRYYNSYEYSNRHERQHSRQRLSSSSSDSSNSRAESSKYQRTRRSRSRRRRKYTRSSSSSSIFERSVSRRRRLRRLESKSRDKSTSYSSASRVSSSGNCSPQSITQQVLRAALTACTPLKEDNPVDVKCQSLLTTNQSDLGDVCTVGVQCSRLGMAVNGEKEVTSSKKEHRRKNGDKMHHSPVRQHSHSPTIQREGIVAYSASLEDLKEEMDNSTSVITSPSTKQKEILLYGLEKEGNSSHCSNSDKDAQSLDIELPVPVDEPANHTTDPWQTDHSFALPTEPNSPLCPTTQLLPTESWETVAPNPNPDSDALQNERDRITEPAEKTINIACISEACLDEILRKKRLIEAAYRLDCETYTTVVRMLISLFWIIWMGYLTWINCETIRRKNPDLHRRLACSLQELLQEQAKRSIQELQQYIQSLAGTTQSRDD